MKLARLAERRFVKKNLRCVRHITLDLQRIKVRAAAPSGQEEGQDPRAGTEVRHTIPLLHPGEIRQKHRIHDKAEAALLLDDPQALQLQIVNALVCAKGH